MRCEALSLSLSVSPVLVHPHPSSLALGATRVEAAEEGDKEDGAAKSSSPSELLEVVVSVLTPRRAANRAVAGRAGKRKRGGSGRAPRPPGGGCHALAVAHAGAPRRRAATQARRAARGAARDILDVLSIGSIGQEQGGGRGETAKGVISRRRDPQTNVQHIAGRGGCWSSGRESVGEKKKQRARSSVFFLIEFEPSRASARSFPAHTRVVSPFFLTERGYVKAPGPWQVAPPPLACLP